MSGQSISIALLPRKYDFPFKVRNIYYCWRWIRPVDYLQIIDEDCLEISIRLDCTAAILYNIVWGPNRPMRGVCPYSYLRSMVGDPLFLCKCSGLSPTGQQKADFFHARSLMETSQKP